MYLGREVKLAGQCLEKIFVRLFSMIRLNLRNSGLICSFNPLISLS